MVAARFLYHVRHQFRRNGRPALVLFILPSVRKQRDDGCNSLCACNFARVYHDTKLHEGRVDLPTACVDDIDIVLPHRLDDAYTSLANSTLGHFCFPDGQAEAAR